MRDDGGGHQPPSRCPSSLSAAECGPHSAGRLPWRLVTPRVPACRGALMITDVGRSASPFGMAHGGPAGSTQAAPTRAAGMPGSSGVCAGCPCSPRARGSRRKQGAGLQVSSKLTRVTDLITEGDTASCPLGPQEAPPGRAVLCLKEGAPLAASLEVSTLCPLFPVLRAPPHFLGTPIDLGGTWLAVKFLDSDSTSIAPSLCLFCVVL